MGKFTISMAIFNSYVSLPEGKIPWESPCSAPRRAPRMLRELRASAVDGATDAVQELLDVCDAQGVHVQKSWDLSAPGRPRTRESSWGEHIT